MIKIAVIGANGKAGSLIVRELKKHPVAVTGIVRRIPAVSDDSLTIIHKDLFELQYSDIQEFDYIINAFNAPLGEEELHQTSLQHLSTILTGKDKPTLVVLGGAGVLYMDDTRSKRVADLASLPSFIVPIAKSEEKAFDALSARDDFNWIYFCPPLNLDVAGEATGRYRYSNDLIPVNAEGESYLSYADYAKAIADFVINPVNENHKIVSVVSE